MISAARTNPYPRLGLRPSQIQALWEWRSVGGLVDARPTGAGKTAVGLLASRDCANTLWLTTNQALASLTRQLKRWPHGKITTCNYEQFSLTGHELLDKVRPDLLVLDEAHCLTRFSARRTRLIWHYCHAYAPRVIALSASLLNFPPSLYAHILGLAIGADIPDNATLGSWDKCLGGSAEPWDWARFAVLARRFTKDLAPTKNQRTLASGCVRRWLETMPGVVLGAEETCHASLYYRLSSIHLSVENRQLLCDVVEHRRRPDGEYFPDLISEWRCLRQLSYGFFYRWSERRPDSWLLARAELHRYIRALIGDAVYLDNRLDSPSRIMSMMERESHPLWLAWVSERDQHGDRPPTEIVWVDRKPAKELRKQILSDQGKSKAALVWCDMKALVAALDLPVLNPSIHQTCVAGTRHATGLDTLTAWNNNWILEPTRNANLMDQLVGRTFRQGQQSDTVTVTIMSHTKVLSDAIREARNNAKYTVGENKLTIGDWS